MTPITLDREAAPRLPQRMIFDGLNCYPMYTFPDWAVKKEGWQYVTVTAESALASTGEGESPESETPETDAVDDEIREKRMSVPHFDLDGGSLRLLRSKARELERRLRAAEAELQAWKSQFGTSQLTHAIARLEAAEKRTDTPPVVLAEAEAMHEALTPSGETKAEYSGEFKFSIRDVDEEQRPSMRSVDVPWTTIKEIMAKISARAIRRLTTHTPTPSDTEAKEGGEDADQT